jgi:hypothetical protein
MNRGKIIYEIEGFTVILIEISVFPYLSLCIYLALVRGGGRFPLVAEHCVREEHL